LFVVGTGSIGFSIDHEIGLWSAAREVVRRRMGSLADKAHFVPEALSAELAEGALRGVPEKGFPRFRLWTPTLIWGGPCGKVSREGTLGGRPCFGVFLWSAARRSEKPNTPVGRKSRLLRIRHKK